MRAIALVVLIVPTILLSSAQEEFWDTSIKNLKNLADELIESFINQTTPAFLEKAVESLKAFSDDLTESVIKQTNTGIKDTIDATMNMIKDIQAFNRSPYAFTVVHINTERVSPITFRRMIRAHDEAYSSGHSYVIAYWVHNSSYWDLFGANDVTMLRNFFPKHTVWVFFNPSSWDSMISAPTTDSIAVEEKVLFHHHYDGDDDDEGDRGAGGNNLRIDRLVAYLDRQLQLIANTTSSSSSSNIDNCRSELDTGTDTYDTDDTSSAHAHAHESVVNGGNTDELGDRDGHFLSESRFDCLGVYGDSTGSIIDLFANMPRTSTYWAVSVSVAWIGSLPDVLQRWSQHPYKEIDFIGTSCGGNNRRSLKINFGFGLKFELDLGPKEKKEKGKEHCKKKNRRNMKDTQTISGTTTAAAAGAGSNTQAVQECIPDIARYSTRLLDLILQQEEESPSSSDLCEESSASSSSCENKPSSPVQYRYCGAHDCALRVAKDRGLLTADLLDVGVKERLIADDFSNNHHHAHSPQEAAPQSTRNNDKNNKVNIGKNDKNKNSNKTPEENDDSSSSNKQRITATTTTTSEVVFKAARERYLVEAQEPLVFSRRAGVLFRNLDCGQSERICEA